MAPKIRYYRLLNLSQTLLIFLALTLGGCAELRQRGQQASAPTDPLPAKGDGGLEEALAGLAFADDRITPVASSDEPPEAASKLLASARARVAEQHFLAALSELRFAAMVAPDRAEIYAELGRVLARLNEPQRAIAAFRTAQHFDPVRFAAPSELGDLLSARGRHEEAIELWQAVLDAESDHGRAHARLAVAFYLTGDSRRAGTHLARAEALGAAVPGQLRTLLTAAPRTRAQAVTPPRKSVTIGPPIRIDSGGNDAVNESSAVAGDPDEVSAAWHAFEASVPNPCSASLPSFHIAAGASTDGGATWTTSPLPAPAGTINDISFDPMTATERDKVYAGGIARDCQTDTNTMFVAARDFGQTTWTPRGVIQASESLGGSQFNTPDKGFLVAEPTISVFSRLYAVYNMFAGSTLNEGRLRVSETSGATWNPPKSLELGRGYLPRLGPVNQRTGTRPLYIVYLKDNFGDDIRLVRSFDHGATLDTPVTVTTRMASWVDDNNRIPGSFINPTYPYLAVDPNEGTLYVVYFDITSQVGTGVNVDLYLTRSTDQGATWATPTVIESSGGGSPPRDQFFPWIEVGDSGRLHLVFYDTRHGTQSDSANDADLDVYYAYSDDGGATWQEHRLTSSSFLASDASSYNPPQSQFIGDYTSLAIDGDIAYPIYMAAPNGDSDMFVRVVTP